MKASLIKVIPILSIACLLLACVVCMTYWYRSGMKELSDRARMDLQRCEKHRLQIESLRTVTPTKRPDEHTQEKSLSRVREGLVSCGIAESVVTDIRINGQVAIPKTDYLREDTLVTLHSLDLLALMRFIRTEELQVDGTICSVIDLRFLEAPVVVPVVVPPVTATEGQQPPSDKWDIQLTLTHLVEQSLQERKRKRQ